MQGTVKAFTQYIRVQSSQLLYEVDAAIIHFTDGETSTEKVSDMPKATQPVLETAFEPKQSMKFMLFPIHCTDIQGEGSSSK